MLTEALISVLATSLITSGVSVYAQKHWVSKWVTREFAGIRFSWKQIFVTAAVSAGAIAFITGYLLGSVALATLFATTVYILTFSGIVDFYTKKAPYEMTTAGILLALVLSGITYLTGVSYLGETITGNLLQDSLLQTGMWTVMVFFFLITIQILQPGGMGFADYKIMWLAGFTYAGFIGFVETGIMFTAGILLQGAGFLYQRIKNRNSNVAAILPENTPDMTSDTDAASSVKSNEGRNKTLPLIPALAITYIIGNVWFLVTY